MAKFCAKCGTPAAADARFCDDCGAPLKQPEAGAAPAAVTLAAKRDRSGKRAGLVAGGVLALGAAVGGLAYLTADETASPEVFTKAIGRYYENNPAAAAKLLCANDLQLDADPVVVGEFEGSRRATMDGLVTAGLFSSPEVHSGGGFLAIRDYRYSRTEAGRRAIKDGKLCLAPAVQITGVRYDQPAPGTHVSAQFHYELKQPEPWLTGELAERLTRSIDLDDHVAVLELRDGKWIMTSDDLRAAHSVDASRAASPAPSLLQRVKGWFRIGNPLIGQWRVTNFPWLAGARISFSAEQAAVGRPDEAVRYDINGDRITVHYVERNASDVFIVQDDDHIRLAADKEEIQLERIKD